MVERKYLTIVAIFLVFLLINPGCLQDTRQKEISNLKEQIKSMNTTIRSQREIIETQMETIENYKKMVIRLQDKISKLNESFSAISQIKEIVECKDKKNVTIIRKSPYECEELFAQKATHSLIIALKDDEVKEDIEDWGDYYFDYVIISEVKNLDRFKKIDLKIHAEVWNVTIHAVPKKWKEIYKDKTYMIYVDVDESKVLDREER